CHWTGSISPIRIAHVIAIVKVRLALVVDKVGPSDIMRFPRIGWFVDSPESQKPGIFAGQEIVSIQLKQIAFDRQRIGTVMLPSGPPEISQRGGIRPHS